MKNKEMRKQDLRLQVTIPQIDPMMDKEIKQAVAEIMKKYIKDDTKVEYDPHNMTMMSDMYQFTMGQVNHMYEDYNVIEYFDEFFRKEPLDAGYGVVAGLDQIIDYIEHLHFTDEDIDWFRKQNKFTEEYLDYLRHFQFSGDIYAIPDGTVVFRNEPLVTVVAPSIECKIIETALLSITNGHVAYATAAAKIVNAAGDAPVMSFGARRAYGPHAACDADKAACMAGAEGTSNCKAAKDYDLKAMGTMGHDKIMEEPSEYDAFYKYAKAFPDKPTFLTDTYNNLNGVRTAIKACIDAGVEFGGIRIDSGDLAYEAKEARKIMDEKFPNSKICLSNGLTAETIESLKRQGACFDSLGVGDNISSPDKRVGAVYKNAAVEKDGKIIPKIKLSGDTIKTTNPGYKKIYRFYDNKTGYAIGDVIAMSDEKIPTDEFTLVHESEPWKKQVITDYTVKELQTQIYKDGKLVYDMPTFKETREYCKKQMATLYPEVKRNEKPHQYYVDLTDKLRKLKTSMIADIAEENAKVKKIGGYPHA